MQGTLDCQGYYLAAGIFPQSEVDTLRQLVTEDKGVSGFGVRYYLEHKPAVLQALLACQNFLRLVRETFSEPVIIKSVYFDKPPRANWTVAWHQDITLNLTEKLDHPSYSNWRELEDRVAAQPPTELLEQITAYRIHLDDTDATNGALRIVEGSHLRGIQRVDEHYHSSADSVRTLCINAGGVQLMKPLLFHSSRRVEMGDGEANPRRVIHLEVMEKSLTVGLPLREYFALD
ncbi:phytanoyl-CoA dioxygenase family protein [Neolewinella sp.]|uniref:phytanoyl-CoA dioxygenase family protein n=1 Tax=Neolewinella sp. TaxID=2993543 RepID=UPI003B5288E1